MEMLRNEVRYMTAAASVPGNLDCAAATLGRAEPVRRRRVRQGRADHVTELLGRTPWFYRMADMVADAMDRAPHDALGPAAGVGQRVERRLPAGPGAPLDDDR